MAQRTQVRERKNSNKLEDAVKKAFGSIVKETVKRGDLPKDLMRHLDVIDDAIMEMFFETSLDALKVSRQPQIKMANVPKGFIPKSLKDLRIKWDEWKKKGKMTPRQKVLAENLKKEYIKRVQSVWEKKAEDFREGREFTQEKVSDALKQAAAVPKARAQTIAATETTRYYNQARIERYGSSPDFTHFLFLALRDHRTTSWCKDRHGLVYEKGSSLLEDETPPIHWNCRSEVVALSPLNPKHKTMIDDRSKMRINKSCTPLPTGWNLDSVKSEERARRRRRSK